jgi:hypothetical protein
MKPASWGAADAWAPSVPSADFADRVIAAALRERGARRLRARRASMGGVAAALALAAGGAFARTSLHGAARAEVAPDVPGVESAPTWRRHAAAPMPSSVPEADFPAPPARRSVPMRKAVPPATAAQAPPPEVIVPSCECRDWACDCVEVPWMARPLTGAGSTGSANSTAKGKAPCEGLSGSGGCVPVPFSR